MNEFLNNLKKQAADQPLVAVGIGVGALKVLDKLLNTGATRKKAKAWDKEVNRRVKKSK